MTKKKDEEKTTDVAVKEQETVLRGEEMMDPETGELTSSSYALPADFLGEVEGLDDLGYSEKSEDSMIPILAILQDNSAEVKKRHSRYIEGAEPGDLIIRSLQRVIKMGDELPPLVLQPAGFDHVWVEWAGEPGEGSPVGQYPFEERPEEAEEVQDPQDPDRTQWRMPNGNRLVDTRYHYCNMLEGDGSAMPIVVPMGGTNHTTSRSWTAQMKQHRIPGRQAKAPSFFRRYGLRTRFRQRGEQSWYNYNIEDQGWIPDDGLLRAGLNLLRAVREQTMVAETSAATEEGSGDNSQGASPI